MAQLRTRCERRSDFLSIIENSPLAMSTLEASDVDPLKQQLTKWQDTLSETETSLAAFRKVYEFLKRESPIIMSRDLLVADIR